jgi:hypothetical protein
MVPLSAARTAMGVTSAPAADPNAPGPFAFAAEQGLRAIFTDAGLWRCGYAARRCGALYWRRAVRSRGRGADRAGIRLVREAAAEHPPVIVEAAERALDPLAAADGHVRLNGSTRIESITDPA